ncbi:hypothetical protein A3A39_00315 [Candidatus Kaiserbacteria bacterium RIFCSPLOWO2_01_FULL_54_13]|uniref:Bacterial Pleckstrin homology domain-containing protein n=1 Tax=Candidatus Kaiserbacteria bacterium RIFCSPLOWO2_01_FULL_54_13 TaxID=1798512 RepID=A0A1F6F3T5_9BACT|nr:MAG: hypothetical protein A3A39_00315 [Candidatus Kaiserbacteria bacterium RIFCSPLOWO2_01_FULL_54_13]
MTLYKHTQIGYLILFVALAVTVFFAWLYWNIPETEPRHIVAALMTVIVFILVSFSTLTVTIDEQFVQIKFGYGIFRKKFLLSEITSAKAVKNHWYYGWGIRIWFWPYMWIYNVSGFDAVEIVMKSGKIYRIGTDVPIELEMALCRVIRS